MKANELMIGDWVLVSNTPLKIAALGTIKAGFMDAKGEMFYQYYDNIEPIPLTAEILEKNFQKDRMWVDGYTIADSITIYNTGEGYWTIGYLELIELRYVHELQHTLKLCGIDKEIKL